jgi:hypothetical protein
MQTNLEGGQLDRLLRRARDASCLVVASVGPGADVLTFNIFAEKIGEKIGVFDSKQS